MAIRSRRYMPPWLEWVPLARRRAGSELAGCWHSCTWGLLLGTGRRTKQPPTNSRVHRQKNKGAWCVSLMFLTEIPESEQFKRARIQTMKAGSNWMRTESPTSLVPCGLFMGVGSLQPNRSLLLPIFLLNQNAGTWDNSKECNYVDV